MKRNISIGVILPAFIGVIWAVLYWRNHLPYALVIILSHVFCGAMVSLCVLSYVKILGRKINPSGLVGFILGIFWVSPILLFIVDLNYINIKVNLTGFFILAIVLSAVGLSGYAGGVLTARYNSKTLRFAGILILVGLPVKLAMLSPADSHHNFTIVDRLNASSPVIMPQSKVMVFGIDGATWDVLIPLLKKGKLQNLRHLMEKGQYGNLYSLKTAEGHMASPVIWTSIFTGKSPEKHGLVDWTGSDSRNRFCKSLWNISNDFGQKAIVVNIPGTFPPEKIRGAQISGFPIPSIAKSSKMSIAGISHGRLYTTENEKLRVLPVRKIRMQPVKQQPRTPHSFSHCFESLLPLTERIEKKFGELRIDDFVLQLGNIFIKLLDRFEIFETHKYANFYMLISDAADDNEENYDTLHIFRNKSDPNPLAVLKADQWTDWITIAIEEAEAAIKLKLLSLSKDKLEIYSTPPFQSSASPRIPFTYPLNVASALTREIGQYVVEGAGWTMFEDDITLDLLYEHIEQVGDQHMRASEYLLKTVNDWKLFIHIYTESDRLQHAFWKFHEPEPYQSVDDKLRKAHHYKINSIIERIDASIGHFLRYMDDDTTVVVLSDHGFQAEAAHNCGGHHEKGVYILAGKNIKEPREQMSLDQTHFPEANVLDISPTILYLMGYPVGGDMDGKVLAGILDEDKLENRPVVTIDSYDKNILRKDRARQVIDKSTRDQLKSLGYVK